MKKLEQAKQVYLNHQHGSLCLSDTITRTIDGEQIKWLEGSAKNEDQDLFVLEPVGDNAYTIRLSEEPEYCLTVANGKYAVDTILPLQRSKEHHHS